MEKFELNNEKQEKGENVEVHAIFMRHGEKEHNPDNPETGLTLRGEWESREAGQGLSVKDMIKGYSSDTERTIDTSGYVVEQSPTDKKGKARLRKELGFHYDPEGEFLKQVLKIKNDILINADNLGEEELKEKLEEATTKQIDYYLNFGEERPDSETYSPKETAADMAKLVSRYLKMPDKLKSGSNIDLLNVTHDFNLAAFLKEVLVREKDRERVVGFDSIEEIGGGFGFNENFELLITTDENQNKKIKILLRGEEYDIDMDNFNKLLNRENAESE